MHVHLPKPLHGWREFLGEVGIIVIGVLIALAAEQAIEQVHWHHKVEQTREQLDEELRADAKSAYLWLSVMPCLQTRLDAIDTAVRTARTTGKISPLPAYTPELVLFTNDAWLNARSLQVADHLPPDVMHDYALVYFFPAELQGNIIQLHSLAAELAPITKGLDHVSPDEAGAYQRLIGKVRELQDRTGLAETLLLSRTRKLGVALSDEEMRKALQAARDAGSACVRRPDLEAVSR